MANDLFIPQGFGNLAAAFGGADAAAINDEATAGISGGFGVISIRGKQWGVKYRGEETEVLDDRGEKAPYLDVVIIKTAPHLSKVYYPNGYVPGSTEAPGCSSANAITPDVGVEAPCAASCKACPNDIFGSRITEAGKKGKACSDSKRAVVVPYPDMGNEAYGGPLLLRIPAASLQELTAYVNKLKAFGAPYCAVVTRLRFTSDAFPKITFQPLQALNDEEAIYALGLRDDPQTARILNEVEANVVEAPDSAADPAFANVAANLAPAARQAPVPPARPAPAAAPRPAPAPAARAPVAAPVAAARPPVVAARPPVAAAGPAKAGTFGAKPATIAAAVAAPIVRPAAPVAALPPAEEYSEEAQDESTDEGYVEGAAPDAFMTDLDAAIAGIMG